MTKHVLGNEFEPRLGGLALREHADVAVLVAAHHKFHVACHQLEAECGARTLRATQSSRARDVAHDAIAGLTDFEQGLHGVHLHHVVARRVDELIDRPELEERLLEMVRKDGSLDSLSPQVGSSQAIEVVERNVQYYLERVVELRDDRAEEEEALIHEAKRRRHLNGEDDDSGSALPACFRSLGSSVAPMTTAPGFNGLRLFAVGRVRCATHRSARCRHRRSGEVDDGDGRV